MAKKWALVALVVVVLAAVGGYFGGPARAGGRAQDCGDWVEGTRDQLLEGRSYVYPSGRPDAFDGSVDEAIQLLDRLSQEQADSDPPDNAILISDDLVEAFASGAEGLAQGGAEGAILLNFAKSIIYNADARLFLVNDSC